MRPSKLWAISIFVAGVAGFISMLAVNDKFGMFFSIIFTVSLWLFFGYVESNQNLKTKIKEALKLD